MTPKEQEDLDHRLIDAAWNGRTETVKALLAHGANAYADNDYALCLTAWNSHTETVEVLLANGADVHARNDLALRWAAFNGHTETVQALARRIFAPDSWRGKKRTEIEAYATALYTKIESHNPQSEHLRQAGSILVDCALTCWEQVRPAPPRLTISLLPAQPRPW